MMKDIEQALHSLHESARQKSEVTQGSTESISNNTHPPPNHNAVPKWTPFASVQTVQNGSPASQAGLCSGDQIIRFAHIHTQAQFPDISSVVQSNQEKQIEVEVIRQGNVVGLVLIPSKWEGEGLLGCYIVPI